VSDLAWILRFGELGLKSRPVRRQFHRGLRDNIEQRAVVNQCSMIRQRIGQMDVITTLESKKEIEKLLHHTLGAVVIERVRLLEGFTPEQVSNEILERDADKGVQRTFGVRVRRVGKKGEWSSQTFAGAVGASMLSVDNSLSVNLSKPDFWVRLILEPERVWHVESRMNGPGGLPPGVQGDVLARIKSEEDLLSCFLLMRRGARILPHDSDEELLKILQKWDGFLGERTPYRTQNGKRLRPPWGVYGMSIEESHSIIPNESDLKRTPRLVLDPLCGWDENEKLAMLNWMKNPQSGDIPSLNVIITESVE